MNDVDLTFDGVLNGMLSLEDKAFKVLYTIDHKTNEPTTVSILVDKEKMLMVTFNYQDLKKIVEN